MGATDVGRVFVGLDGSLASLRALHRAVAEARRRDADLYAVHVRPPTPRNLDGTGHRGSIPKLAEWLDHEADRLIETSLRDGLGGAPDGVRVHRAVRTGRPGQVLVDLGRRDDDLIVVGTGTHGRLRSWLRGLRRRSVTRHCLAHARCPVLVVPPDTFTRSVEQRAWLGRALRRRSVWKESEAAGAAESQRVA